MDEPISSQQSFESGKIYIREVVLNDATLRRDGRGNKGSYDNINVQM